MFASIQFVIVFIYIKKLSVIFNLYLIYIWIGFLVLKGTQSKNISFALWRSVLFVKETRIHGEYQRPSLIHCPHVSHNVVLSIPPNWEWCWPLIPWEDENTTAMIFANLVLIDWLMFNVQRAIFQLYSGRAI